MTTNNNNEDGLKGLAVASVICGIASWFVLALVLAPMGTIFAVLAMKAKDNSTKTWATIGLIIGVVSLAFLLFSLSVILHIK